MFGVSSRGHTSRDSDRCGAPFSAAPTASDRACRRPPPARAPRPSCPSDRAARGTASPARRSAASAAARRTRARELHAVLLAHDHQAQPRPQLRVRVGARRREQPRESRRDRTRSTESSSARSRCCPARGSVRTTWCRSMPTTSAGPRSRSGTAGSGVAVDVERDRHVGNGGLFRAERVDGRDGAGGALSHPGQKTQVGVRPCRVYPVSLRVRGRARSATAPAAVDRLQHALVFAPRASPRARPCSGRRLGRRHDRPARGRQACGPVDGVVAEARPADAPHRRPARGAAAREDLQLHRRSASVARAPRRGGTTGGVPSSVIGMCSYSSGAGMTCAASNEHAGFAEHRTRPPSISNDGAASFSSSLISKNCAGANGALCGVRGSSRGAERRGDGEAARAGDRRAAEEFDVAPRVERHDLLADAQLPERVEHDRRARPAARQAAQRHAVRLGGAALGGPARRRHSACVSCASTSTAGGSGGRSPFTSVVSKRTLKSHHRISNVALPLTRSGRGPSSAPFSVTMNRLCEPRFSCSRAWKSAMKCSGMSCTSTSKPTSPSTLKPAALA